MAVRRQAFLNRVVVAVLLFTQSHWGENWQIDTNPGEKCLKGIGTPVI
jgi:hypothetical protein